jgi:hypothetical protein
LVDSLAAAESLEAGLRAVGALLLQEGAPALAGVEWWRPGDGSFRVAFTAGDANGARTAIPLGLAGALVLVGELPPDLEHDLARLRPLLRHRWIEEQLATHATRLARKNEALEDFAALVAHDVKSSLVYAQRSDEPREAMTRTIELVDSILEAVRVDEDGHAASVADCVQQALADLGTSMPTSSRARPATFRFHQPPSASSSGTCSQTHSRPAPTGSTSPPSPMENGAHSSSTTTASASDRPTATPPGPGSASLSAAGSPIALEERSSSSLAPSVEPAR